MRSDNFQFFDEFNMLSLVKSRHYKQFPIIIGLPRSELSLDNRVVGARCDVGVSPARLVDNGADPFTVDPSPDAAGGDGAPLARLAVDGDPCVCRDAVERGAPEGIPVAPRTRGDSSGPALGTPTTPRVRP